jgi:phosphoribosylanthranilate isomerase
VKICCIASIDEAKLAVEAGASAIGLVGNMPSGPGPIPDELIRRIALTVPPPIASFLLTSETSSKGIIDHYNRTQTSVIQLVDMPKEDTYADLRQALPSVKIVQVIHVLDEESVEQAITISAMVDAILLDSGNPNLEIKELGGTGRVHNWNLSLKIRLGSYCPVFLAGGLNVDNVRAAIETVEPFGIDVCSGVRTNGKLDITKLHEFMHNALI